MSELRQDPFTDRWVVIARNRAERPREFTQLETRRDAATCPFCLGNERETPQEVASYRDPNALTNIPRMQGNIEDLHKLGVLPMTIDVSKYVDMSIAKEAAKRLKGM